MTVIVAPVTPMPWDHESPLTQALYHLRMRGAFYSWTESWGRGSLEMPRTAGTLSFHIVADGTAWLETDGAAPRPLPPGQLALVPRGLGHRISTTPGAPILGRADELPQEKFGESFSVLRVGEQDGPPSLSMLCGIVAFDSSAVQDMLAVLPSVVEVDSAGHPVMAALVPLLAAEMQHRRPGGEAVATRLADVLVVETVRAWLAQEPDGAQGWLAALRDPLLGRAIAAIHAEPGRTWKVEDLARLATLSRSTFSARFTAVVGEPPMSYLSATRMRGARAMLRQGRAIREVALTHGYGSEAAFSRAFVRATGLTPGSARSSRSVGESAAAPDCTDVT